MHFSPVMKNVTGTFGGHHGVHHGVPHWWLTWRSPWRSPLAVTIAGHHDGHHAFTIGGYHAQDYKPWPWHWRNCG